MPDKDLDKMRHQYKMTERLGKDELLKKGDRQGYILEKDTETGKYKWINR